MAIDAQTAINRLKSSIDDLRESLSLINCQRLYAEITGYNRALLDCGIISETQWKQIHHQASTAFANWKGGPIFPT